jgi:hypothetical protein
MTDRRVLIVGSAGHAVIDALVGSLEDHGRDVLVVDESTVRKHVARHDISDILAGIEEYTANFKLLIVSPQELKRLYLCCLTALNRALLAAYHRAFHYGANTPVTLLAYTLARDGPKGADSP